MRLSCRGLLITNISSHAALCRLRARTAASPHVPTAPAEAPLRGEQSSKSSIYAPSIIIINSGSMHRSGTVNPSVTGI